MKTLLQHPHFEQQVIADLPKQPIAHRQTCPCCSNVLLRHVSSGKLFWRCSDCGLNVPG
ncbi:MAG: hypothetical protein AAF282_11155 [Cyanobacteria bacterium P01_A01_bin.15]